MYGWFGAKEDKKLKAEKLEVVWVPVPEDKTAMKEKVY